MLGNMSLYERQTSPTRNRRDRVLVIDAARPAAPEPHNPDIKPSQHAKKSLKVFAVVVIGMILLMVFSVKMLEHLWSRRDRAIMHSVRSHREEAVPAVLSPVAPMPVPELPSPPVDRVAARVKLSAQEEVETIFRWGQVLEDAGELQGALTRYEEALAVDPNHPLVLSKVGRLNIRLGRYAAASAALTRAHAAAEDNPDIMNDLGVAMTFDGRAADAVTLYHDLLARHPEYVPALFNQGYALVQLRDYEQARPRLEAYIEQKADDAMALGVLAILELAEKNHEKALTLLDRAIEVSPQWSTPYLDAAAICASLNQNDRALGYLERALEIASPAEVYQLYTGPAFRNLRTSEEGKVLEKNIADRARLLIK